MMTTSPSLFLNVPSLCVAVIQSQSLQRVGAETTAKKAQASILNTYACPQSLLYM
jgi:hypothetical protein